jgi:3-oxoacyl-[acyl-carrier protein] reductase
MNFKDKVVLITGGSRGIGAEIAASFGRAGAKVCINYINNKAKAEEVLKDIEKNGGAGTIFQADVADQNAVNKMIEAITAKYEKIDILINNANAPLNIKPIVSLAWEDYQQDLDITIKGTLNTSKAAVKTMLKNKYGRIINIITSAVHDVPPPNWSTYVTAKSALIGLSKSLAVEFGPYGINTNMVSPGLTETDLTSAFNENIKMSAAKQTTKKRLGTSGDVAQAVLFLASEQADFINGVNLPVTGGTTM